MKKPIYLDYNGTTPHHPEVIAAMRPFLETEFGNPSSGHLYGIAPKQAVEKARRQVATLLGCAPKEILFTSGGTEANNHAICGAVQSGKTMGSHIITSAIEHPAVLEVCRFLEARGHPISIVPVDSSGMVSLSDIEQTIRPETALISVMHANNEVGTIQPIAEIAALAHKNGIILHTDAAQSVGKIPVLADRLQADLISIAGHKLYAPKGIGALFVRKGLTLEKFCHGAGQESGRRAGTENVLEIAGLGAACDIAGRDFSDNQTHLQSMRDRLYAGITACRLRVRMNGHPRKRLPNTLSLSFKGLEANRILEEIGLDVAASAGAACHAGTVDISHVLEAMRVPVEWAKGTVRFSTGRMTTAADIDKTIAVVVAAVKRLANQP